MLKCIKVKRGGMVKQENNVSFWKMLKFEFKLCFGNCPFLMTGEAIASVIHGLSIVSITIVTQWFFDLLPVAITGGDYTKVINGAIIFGLVIISNQIINGAENYLWNVTYQKIKGFSYRTFFEKVVEIKAESFEASEFMDKLHKAKEGRNHFFQPLMPCIGLSTFYLAYFMGMTIYMVSLHPTLIFSILLVFFPTMIGEYLKAVLFSKLADDAAPYRRRVEYFEKCVSHKDFVKETRTLSAIPFFLDKYSNEMVLLKQKVWKTNVKATVYSMATQFVTLAGYLGILILLSMQLIKGNISIGAFGAIFASVEKIFSMMNEVVETVNETVENIGYMRDYIRFMERPLPTLQEKQISVKNKICLENVSYRYQNAERDVFTNLTLSLKTGETIAIVGENGSGKTTLVKLLLGVYKPTNGKVYYDKVDINKINLKSLWKEVSIVCQNFTCYQMTLRDNILIGCGDIGEKGQDGEVKKILNYVGMDKYKGIFVEDLDTQLGRTFDGVELSGGQWQRIAIARGIFRASPILFMDEPTAALDPIEESSLFELFKKVGSERTAIIVTHRLGCAKIADRIIVMDGGKIVESGTHEELLLKNGRYASMYWEQAQWYK